MKKVVQDLTSGGEDCFPKDFKQLIVQSEIELAWGTVLIKVNLESICMIWGILLVAEKKKILYMVEAMGGGVFTYIVDSYDEDRYNTME